MFYSSIKVILSALIIVAASETAKRSALLGALLASLPIVSYLSIIWLQLETRNVEQVASYTQAIFWMVLPTLPFFLILPALLRNGLAFLPSLVLSTTIMVTLYFGSITLLKKFGIS